MIEHRLDLFTGDTRKPFEEIVDRCAALKILEKRPHRHARRPEKPFATDLSRDSFNDRALGPVEHNVNCSLSPAALLFLPAKDPVEGAADGIDGPVKIVPAAAPTDAAFVLRHVSDRLEVQGADLGRF
jgi:hypothetical protein